MTITRVVPQLLTIPPPSGMGFLNPSRMTQIRGLCPSCSPGRCPDCALEAGGGHPLSCVFVPSTSITCRSVLSSPARISIRRGLASGATGIWIVSTPCS